MKKSEIKVGGHYTARISGRLVTVRVDGIEDTPERGLSRPTIAYHCINLSTGRKTTFRSAMKFRSEVKVKTVLSYPGDKDIPMETIENPTPAGASLLNTFGQQADKAAMMLQQMKEKQEKELVEQGWKKVSEIHDSAVWEPFHPNEFDGPID